MQTNTANPAPLGLMGFGMTTILLNITNAGLMPFSVIILSMGFFYGGIAQVLAGIMEYKKGNTFGLTAFTSYGVFWLTLVFILILPKTPLADATVTDEKFTGVYLALWGIFTLFMFIATLKANRTLQFVFITLFILFTLLAYGHICGNPTVIIIAGYEGIVCGASAIYLAMAEVINEHFNKTILPIGNCHCTSKS